jgi:predicted enzyme related to lactoylglutathione lyase
LTIKVSKTYFMVMVTDMDRAIDFYVGTLGLAERFRSPEWSELAWHDAIVALHGGGDESERQTGLGFEVDDLEAACAAIEAAGGRVMQPPGERPGEPIRLAMTADTEGNVFSLAQPV